MVGRVLAGQDWWVEGGRSRCEALYRAHAPTRPTHFIVAIREKEAGDGVGGDTARAGDERGQGRRATTMANWPKLEILQEWRAATLRSAGGGCAGRP